MHDSHRGATEASLFAAPADGRVAYLIAQMLQHDPLGKTLTGPLADPARATAGQASRLGSLGRTVVGTVIHAIPFLNWYKVQLGNGGGWLGCCHLDLSKRIPIGPRQGAALASGSRVLVWREDGSPVGVILGVLPAALEDASILVPGWLTQGSGAGFKREPAHLHPIKNMPLAGGAVDFSCQTPLDATSLEHSLVTPTGIAFLVSDFEAFLRVSELCGLWLNLWDQHLTLCGWNLDLLSAAHELAARHDEGEVLFKEMTATYPWEALGLTSPGTSLTDTFDDGDVQYRLARGKVDLPEGQEDSQPIYRCRRYGGYLGQGGLRYLVRPNPNSERQRFSDNGDGDEGLFCESLGLDGSYVLQSAKSLIFAKRSKIVVPKEIKPPEDANGDDARAGNYKFSGQFGDAAAHRIGEVAVDGDYQSLRRVAGVEDLLAHAINWQRLHPFHYHQGDYRTAQELETTSARVQEPLDFTELETKPYLQDPGAVPLRIDHRYETVSYFEREASLAFLDDGNVVLRGGCGEELAFVNGTIRLSCPGDVQVLPGRTALLMTDQIVLKAQDSVDVTSSRRDVRLRAYQNLHLLGEGGVLVEAKSDTRDQLYANLVGEDVRGSGIVFKSTTDIGLLADALYLRSGAGVTGTGPIVLDAAAFDDNIVLQAAAVDAFTTGPVTIWHFSSADGVPEESHRFGPDGCHHETSLTIAFDCAIGVCDGGDLLINGGVQATQDIQSGGRLADRRGSNDDVGQVDARYVVELRQRFVEACQEIRDVTTAGSDAKNEEVDLLWYGPAALGEEAQLTNIGFSYRDADQAGAQYGTGNLVFPESHWQQMVRLAQARGGDVWEENPVSYQGRQLHPWPGRVAWQEQPLLLRLANYTMFDAAAGIDQDRPGPYEEASLADWAPATLADGFLIITGTNNVDG